jgi:hypothetical protein
VALQCLRTPSIVMVAAAGIMLVAYYLYVMSTEPEVLGLAMARSTSPHVSVNNDAVRNSGRTAA